MMKMVNSGKRMPPEEMFDTGQHNGLQSFQGDAGETLTEQQNNDDMEAAGENGTDDSPSCSFYACFACERGHCTALKDNNFSGSPCPFFKDRKQVSRERKAAYDQLLHDNRQDLITRYGDVMGVFGFQDPSASMAPADDIEAARAIIQEFRQELAEGTMSDGGLPDDEYDLEGLMNEKENGSI